MILGHHVIISAYGFWLPNDPRGSWSIYVGSRELRRFGPATKVETTQSVAGAKHDRASRLAAKETLKYPAVHFTGIQARAIGRGFANYSQKSKLTVWACAILPEHVHIAFASAHIPAEQVVVQLKGEATRQLIKERHHPFQEIVLPNRHRPKCWARDNWDVYLDSDRHVRNAIHYVEQNPLKEGKPRQNWPFVTPYV